MHFTTAEPLAGKFSQSLGVSQRAEDQPINFEPKFSVAKDGQKGNASGGKVYPISIYLNISKLSSSIRRCASPV